jgi:hypothetical protein
MQIYRPLERTIRHGLGLMFPIVAMKVEILTDPQALVARHPTSLFKLFIDLFIFNKVSLFLYYFFSVSLFNLMLTPIITKIVFFPLIYLISMR